MPKVNVNSVDLKKLEETFIAMDNEKGLLGLALLDEINFQKKTLSKMRKEIDENSLIAEYSNYKRSNPVIAGYNAMVNNYSKLIRQAVDLLPKDLEIEDNFDDFVDE